MVKNVQKNETRQDLRRGICYHTYTIPQLTDRQTNIHTHTQTYQGHTSLEIHCEYSRRNCNMSAISNYQH
jgi:transcriptional regulator of aromatic amino acid metabolism